MTDPVTISAEYTLRPSELAATLALLVEARQPVVVWGPPGSAKSMIAQQVAAGAGRAYPEAEPAFDVLWVNHGDPPGDWNREPWGERIDMAAATSATPETSRIAASSCSIPGRRARPRPEQRRASFGSGVAARPSVAASTVRPEPSNAAPASAYFPILT